VSNFFDRHQRYDKFFSDHTSRVLNTWVSEFHISFYQLVDRPVSSRGIPKPYENEFPTGSARTLARASMGFRFLGDFFDRHWTCHFVQCVPRWADGKHNPLAKPMGSETPDSNPYLSYASPDADRRWWWQRKVLELILLDAMLAEAGRSTLEILHEVHFEPLRRNGDPPPATHTGDRTAIVSRRQTAIYDRDDYFASKHQGLRLQVMLQLVEDELELVFATLAKWETREKDRGHERPRWTRKDESRYRGSIRQLVESTSRRIQDLQRSQAHIVSEKDPLDALLNALRDDLAFIGADNIGLFTYVTIFFLPLGFAVSIFSMNGSPNSDLVATMAIVAAVALIATIVALFNTRRLIHHFTKVSQHLNKHSGHQMRQTALYQNGGAAAASNATTIDSPEKAEATTINSPEEGDATTIDSPEKADADGIPIHDNHRRFLSRDTTSSSWHIWFWIAYMLIELPARRVLLARYAMTTPAHGLSWMVAAWHVGTGLVLLPVFFLSWVLRMLAFAAADVLSLLWGELLAFFSFHSFPPTLHSGHHDANSLLPMPNHLFVSSQTILSHCSRIHDLSRTSNSQTICKCLPSAQATGISCCWLPRSPNRFNPGELKRLARITARRRMRVGMLVYRSSPPISLRILSCEVSVHGKCRDRLSMQSHPLFALLGCTPRHFLLLLDKELRGKHSSSGTVESYNRGAHMYSENQ
jgi:hypothetical protein